MIICWLGVWADSEMYSRVKLQLHIIYTVVRELNKVLRLFLFASHGSRGLQRRQTEESLHTQVMQGTIRPAGAQAPRLVIVGPVRSPIEHLRKKASERSSAMAQPMKPAIHKVHEHGPWWSTATGIRSNAFWQRGRSRTTDGDGPRESDRACPLTACSNVQHGSAAIAIAVRSGTIRHEHDR